jgi:hypothetical protein
MMRIFAEYDFVNALFPFIGVSKSGNIVVLI